MRLGALIVTTGLSRAHGIAALKLRVGGISAGQRMIAAFQRCGVTITGLVVGPEDKKSERQFARTGVIFLRCPEHASFEDGVRAGLSFMAEKFDRVFVVPGDMPLFLPKTLETLLLLDAPIAIPVRNRIYGAPILLRSDAVRAILSADAGPFEQVIQTCPKDKSFVTVQDSGVLIRSDDMTHRADHIRLHDRQLIRPSVGIALHSGSALYDDRLHMLLHLAEETRSILDACSLMQISYSAAWKMLNHAEDELGYPLVDRIRGGPDGSGTQLTERGRQLMVAYDRFAEELNARAAELCKTCFAAIPE